MKYAQVKAFFNFLINECLKGNPHPRSRGIAHHICAKFEDAVYVLHSFQKKTHGARYNPTTDSWTPISSIGAPTARLGHVAVWTGSEMIIWGGSTNTGGLYEPVTDSWRPTDNLCAPSGRGREPAIWTGSKMVIWGGTTASTYVSNGYEYDPLMNTWLEITTTGAPSARADHIEVWTGNKVILWGGTDGSVLNSGGLLTP